MSKQPALSTQLKNAQLKISELEKQITAKDNSVTYANSRASALQNEVDQLHAFFDALPQAIAKEPEGTFGKQNSAMTRLAAWLAVRG